jgi:hypothetical protein
MAAPSRFPEIRASMINRGSQTAALHKSLVVGHRDILVEKPRDDDDR